MIKLFEQKYKKHIFEHIKCLNELRNNNEINDFVINHIHKHKCYDDLIMSKPYIIKYFPKKIRSHEKFLYLFIMKNPETVRYIPEKLLNDKMLDLAIIIDNNLISYFPNYKIPIGKDNSIKAFEFFKYANDIAKDKNINKIDYENYNMIKSLIPNKIMQPIYLLNALLTHNYYYIFKMKFIYDKHHYDCLLNFYYEF